MRLLAIAVFWCSTIAIAEKHHTAADDVKLTEDCCNAGEWRKSERKRMAYYCSTDGCDTKSNCSACYIPIEAVRIDVSNTTVTERQYIPLDGSCIRAKIHRINEITISEGAIMVHTNERCLDMGDKFEKFNGSFQMTFPIIYGDINYEVKGFRYVQAEDGGNDSHNVYPVAFPEKVFNVKSNGECYDLPSEFDNNKKIAHFKICDGWCLTVFGERSCKGGNISYESRLDSCTTINVRHPTMKSTISSFKTCGWGYAFTAESSNTPAQEIFVPSSRTCVRVDNNKITKVHMKGNRALKVFVHENCEGNPDILDFSIQQTIPLHPKTIEEGVKAFMFADYEGYPKATKRGFGLLMVHHRMLFKFPLNLTDVGECFPIYPTVGTFKVCGGECYSLFSGDICEGRGFEIKSVRGTCNTIEIRDINRFQIESVRRCLR